MEWYYGSCKEENLQKGKSEEYRSGTLKKDRGEGVNSAASAAYLNQRINSDGKNVRQIATSMISFVKGKTEMSPDLPD